MKLKITEIKTEIIFAEEYEEDTYMDINRLGQEVFIQPTLHEKYSRYVTNLTDERDELKLKIHLKRAELSLEIRSDPEEFGILQKITENTVMSTVDLDPDIEDLTFDLLKLDKYVNEATGALKAIITKGQSLKLAGQLYSSGYWGTLTAIPQKMMEDIDQYLNRGDLTSALQANERLTRRSHGQEK